MNFRLKASTEYTIQVHVRRTGEVIDVKVIPLQTTYGDIINMICDRVPNLDARQYYIAINYEIQMENYMLFEREHRNLQFQMLMKTKDLLLYIAEQSMQKQRLTPEKRHVLNVTIPISTSEYIL